jgi:hypothetical protein
MALPEDREFRATSADDLHKILDCWTRLEVWIALSGRPRPAGIVAAAMTVSKSLFHAHVRTSRAHRLVSGERHGKTVLFSLTPRLRIRITAKSLTIKATADDGAVLSLVIPAGSPAMRLLAAGLWARDHDSPRGAIQVRRRDPSTPPTGSGRPPRRPSGR